MAPGMAPEQKKVQPDDARGVRSCAGHCRTVESRAFRECLVVFFFFFLVQFFFFFFSFSHVSPVFVVHAWDVGNPDSGQVFHDSLTSAVSFTRTIIYFPVRGGALFPWGLMENTFLRAHDFFFIPFHFAHPSCGKIHGRFGGVCVCV